MNILVTGCMGFIGSNLVSHLLNQGHKVIGFDNLSRSSIMPTDRIKKASKDNWRFFRFYEVDVTNYNAMFSIMAANEQVHAIVHLAAVGSIPFSFEHPQVTMHNNVTGFINVFNLTRHLNINKFVYASSSSVYGSLTVNPRTEKKLGTLASPYALSKIVNEQLASFYASAYKSIIGLRFFNVYGPGQSFNSAYSAVIPKFIVTEKPIVNGDGETIRDFTYVDDVSDAIINCLNLNKACNEVLNIGTGQKTTLNQLLTYLNKKEIAIYEKSRHGDVRESWADISSAKKLIGYSPKIKIETGLNLTKAYYESIK